MTKADFTDFNNFILIATSAFERAALKLWIHHGTFTEVEDDLYLILIATFALERAALKLWIQRYLQKRG